MDRLQFPNGKNIAFNLCIEVEYSRFNVKYLPISAAHGGRKRRRRPRTIRIRIVLARLPNGTIHRM